MDEEVGTEVAGSVLEQPKILTYVVMSVRYDEQRSSEGHPEDDRSLETMISFFGG